MAKSILLTSCELKWEVAFSCWPGCEVASAERVGRFRPDGPGNLKEGSRFAEM